MEDHNDAIDGLNQEFQDLGLETLQLQGTNPANGGHWTNAVTMSSLDTAKLKPEATKAPGPRTSEPPRQSPTLQR